MTYHRGTLEEFNAWHENVKILEGIPIDGKIGNVSGVPAPNNQRTMTYSDPISHPVNEDDYIWGYGKYSDENKEILTISDVKILGWFQEEI